MSKSSKNGASSGGDERNMYVRRYKSSSIPSKPSSDVPLAERQSESESVSRTKHSGSPLKKDPGVKKTNPKSKLRSPVKVGLGQATNRVTKPNTVSTNKGVQKPSRSTKGKGQMTKMKQETETLDRKQKSSNVQNECKEPIEQLDTVKQKIETNHADEQSLDQQENGNTNGVNGKEVEMEGNTDENIVQENEKPEQNGEKVYEKEFNEKEDNEKEEFKLHLDADEFCGIPAEEIEKIASETITVTDIQIEIKTDAVPEDLQTDTESYSVDVVESTTSEMSEATESTAPSEIKDKDTESQDTNNDVVSYDSSIMLKDVKIKLNDCLKEKSEEEGGVDQSLPEYAHKGATFGKTLRTISGRSSLDRMRNITLRNRQPSPNSSLFVNTSNVSFTEDGTSDFKILRHRSALTELGSSNGGTPIDRKRKFTEASSSAQKKPKTEERSLLNTSFELLKYQFGLQRPVQVSTPYKFEGDKFHLSTSEEVKADEPGIVKKWCVIM